MSNKPREWWIVGDSAFDEVEFMDPRIVCNADRDDSIHVIEIAAVTDLEEKLKVAVEALKDAREMSGGVNAYYNVKIIMDDALAKIRDEK